MQKKWLIKTRLTKNIKDRQQAIIQALIKNRGLTSKKAQADFFKDDNPHDIKPTEINIDPKQIQKALKRLDKAKINDEKIIIFGDYDADGITATAIMWETLNRLGFDAMPFLPHRQKHGYGIKPQAIDDMVSELGKPKLVITVDNGIVAFEGADHLKKLEIDLIICDHHEPIPGSNKFPENKCRDALQCVSTNNNFPPSLAAIHSTQIAGAGVAYIFAKEILNHFKPKENHTAFLDSIVELAAIGTVADVVPLLNQSRQIVKKGLKLIPKTKRLGLQAMLTESQIDVGKPMSTYHIGYVIAPKINATGRLEHSIESLRLLCTHNKQKAIKLAVDLSLVNKKRQDLTRENLDQIIEKVKSQKPLPKIIITSSKNYNPGVIGLIAGRITENLSRPSIAISIMDGFAKGSVRSVADVNIIEILRVFETDFVELGGHPMAAGFTVEMEKIEKLSQKLQDYAQKNIDDKLLIPTLKAETEIKLSDINLDLYKKIQDFAPFGMSNPRPVFVSRNLQIKSLMTMGKMQQHLKLQLSNPEGSRLVASGYFEAVFFNAGNLAEKLKIGDIIDLAYQIDLNEWNGRRSLQLIVRDIIITHY
jgi:single-stranded-DNA-specific exonuclease